MSLLYESNSAANVPVLVVIKNPEMTNTTRASLVGTFAVLLLVCLIYWYLSGGPSGVLESFLFTVIFTFRRQAVNELDASLDAIDLLVIAEIAMMTSGFDT